jgi:dihydrofolate reductase
VQVILIAAVARNGVIGDHGTIPWHVPADFAHFKATTTGHFLVMGRTTFESIGRVLPGRTTIVLSRDPSWTANGVLRAPSLDSALSLAQAVAEEVVYVAGGAEVYREAMHLADVQLISEIPLEPPGDAFYPDLDPDLWVEVAREPREGFELVRWERLAG